MDNIVLIGMPSSGKSTVGKLLARKLGYSFVDCDDLIRAREGCPLSSTIEKKGVEEFLRIEEEVCCSLDVRKTVIAPGGSVCYSERAMERFKELARIVYLELGLDEIKRRIPNFKARGVVMRGSITTLDALYAERVPLLRAQAEITIGCGNKPAEEIAEEILAAVRR